MLLMQAPPMHYLGVTEQFACISLGSEALAIGVHPPCLCTQLLVCSEPQGYQFLGGEGGTLFVL